MEQYDVDVHQMFTDFKQTYDSVYTSVLYKILVELKPANKVLQNLDCNCMSVKRILSPYSKGKWKIKDHLKTSTQMGGGVYNVCCTLLGFRI